VNTTLQVGDIVSVPWGFVRVHGIISEIYGTSPNVHAVIEISPQLSVNVVDELTTISLPLADITPATIAA
jgi:hypothetical protein